MPAYLVTLDREKSGHTLPTGANAMVVFAANLSSAHQLCAAYFDGEGTLWSSSDATVTEIVADADFDGWTFKVRVLGGLGAGSDEPGEVVVLGDSTDNTMDEIGALLVTGLNALTGIAAASYNSTTNVLTIAETTDGLGDQTVEVEIIPPNGYSSVDSLVGAIAHEGVGGDALKVVLPADAAIIPLVTAPVCQV